MSRKNRKFLYKMLTVVMFFLLIVTELPLISFRKYHTLDIHIFPQIFIEDTPAKKDWHDWLAMHFDSQRVGIGEQGKAATLGNKTDRALEKKMYQQHGLNALLSDVISVNRSVPDVRDNGCLYKKYLTKLPTVGIVIPFHNEYLSTFARTLHSVYNRTPPELLKEIILVDDFSDFKFFKKLEEYVIAHFDKVQFVRLPERMGLIRARLAGARKVSAEVLVVLDAHIEVNYNWLPPLLEPIALNKRTVVSPIIDYINAETLRYSAASLSYGGFSWTLTYIETSSEDLRVRTQPYNNPIMAGGLFALSLDYFWELGGYDEGLEIWGGEQYELSLKIWLCGGKLLNVPCSRVAHHFRGHLNKGFNAKNQNYLIKNKKRVVEVWFDEYKKYFYDRVGSFVEKFNAGDLTKQKALREKLNCKPFNWFFTKFSDILFKDYPPIEHLEYANGFIRSVASPNLCIDALDGISPGLYSCYKSKIAVSKQSFSLRWGRDLRWHNSCFDVPKYYKNAVVILYPCHNKGGTQFWYYDRKNQWLVHGRDGNYCLESLPINRTLFMNLCEKDNVNMKWNFSVVNDTALDNFFFFLKI